MWRVDRKEQRLYCILKNVSIVQIWIFTSLVYSQGKVCRVIKIQTCRHVASSAECGSARLRLGYSGRTAAPHPEASWSCMWSEAWCSVMLALCVTRGCLVLGFLLLLRVLQHSAWNCVHHRSEWASWEPWAVCRDVRRGESGLLLERWAWGPWAWAWKVLLPCLAGGNGKMACMASQSEEHLVNEEGTGMLPSISVPLLNAQQQSKMCTLVVCPSVLYKKVSMHEVTLMA